MKGWIKVHDVSEDEYEVFIKASEIVALEKLYDEEGSYTGLITNRRTACYTVSESPEEVLALINEAEKPWYVKAKEECEKRVDGCVGCPLMSICNETPRTWGLDMIPEEYR